MTIPSPSSRNTATFPPLRTLIPLTIISTCAAAAATMLVLWAWNKQHPGAAASVAISPAMVESSPSGNPPADLPPWGELDKIPIVTEKPEEFVDAVGLSTEPVQWRFTGSSSTQVRDILLQAGLPAEAAAGFLSPPICEDTASGTLIRPTDQQVISLSPAVRGALYKVLGADEANHYQRYPFSFAAGHAEKLLHGRVLPETAAAVQRMLFHRGKAECFADIGVLLRSLPDSRERRRLVKALTRQETLLLKLAVRPDTNIDRLLAYWGKGGRRKDLQPLLQSLSLAPGGARIDAVHLIPGFARQRLYTYPDKVTTGQRDYDCHFTCMNFFRQSADLSFLDSDTVTAALRDDYDVVAGPTQLGDVILYTTNGDNVVHSCVYIADDIVFTKNGANPMQPWTFMTMDNMEIVYPSDSAYKLVTYRLKEK